MCRMDGPESGKCWLVPQKRKERYLVVIWRKTGSSDGHGHRRVGERGRDEQVDDPVCTPPLITMSKVWIFRIRCSLKDPSLALSRDSPVGE